MSTNESGILKVAMKKEAGQSLVEVLIALIVVSMLASALIIAIITGLKNSQFAQKQTQATKFSQDAMDKIRTIRDRDGNVTFKGTTATFSALWNQNMSSMTNCQGSCYFKLVSSGSEVYLTDSGAGPLVYEDLGEGLSRQIIIDDTASLYQSEKNITVRVKWDDTSGSHESLLQTTLTKY